MFSFLKPFKRTRETVDSDITRARAALTNYVSSVVIPEDNDDIGCYIFLSASRPKVEAEFDRLAADYRRGKIPGSQDLADAYSLRMEAYALRASVNNEPWGYPEAAFYRNCGDVVKQALRTS